MTISITKMSTPGRCAATDFDVTDRSGLPLNAPLNPTFSASAGFSKPTTQVPSASPKPLPQIVAFRAGTCRFADLQRPVLTKNHSCLTSSTYQARHCGPCTDIGSVRVLGKRQIRLIAAPLRLVRHDMSKDAGSLDGGARCGSDRDGTTHATKGRQALASGPSARPPSQPCPGSKHGPFGHGRRNAKERSRRRGHRRPARDTSLDPPSRSAAQQQLRHIPAQFAL